MPWFDENRLPTQQVIEFMSQVSKMVNGQIPTITQNYADLAALDAKFSGTPSQTDLVMVLNQGLARFNGTIWVLASDDITPIT